MSDLSRRTVLQTLASLGLLAVGACSVPSQAAGGGTVAPTPVPAPNPVRRFGAEWDSHTRTFMSWPASGSIWEDLLPGVRRDIAGLARAIGDYEEVVMLARPEHADAAQDACGDNVVVVPIPVDDLWARDTVSVFVEESDKLLGVDFHFNGWGNKQKPHDRDAAVAGAVLSKYGIARADTWIVGEGGSFETDGKGTLMVTESSIVNENRNPGRGRQEIEDELKRVLGIRTVIWFDGVRNEDITDAHVDSLVRFAASGAVLLDQPAPGTPPDSWSRAADQARTVLADATDADGRKLEIVELTQPEGVDLGREAVISYVNFYVANKAVFLPKFGDRKADDRAQQILRDHFPGRDIVGVGIDNIASGGGGIHCATHDQPGEPAP